MQVRYYKSFEKDISKIKLKSVADEVEKRIISVKKCESLVDFIQLPGVTKMVGYTDFYRIKFGNYRIGVRIADNVVYFARFGIRSNIYKIFP